jgi:CubicO group peptidase (beta-lactamase class C family)
LTEVLAKQVEHPKAAWERVQLQHLLTNRSGAPGGLDAGGLWKTLWQSKGSPLEQRLILARGVLAQEPEAAPGERYIYSNAGFSLAGAMAERAAKTDYETLMRRELFEPLGMKSAGFGPPGDGKRLSQPLGHDKDGKPVPWGDRADNPAAIAPAGRAHASIADWAKFIALHVDAQNDRARLLSPESFARLHTAAEGPGQAYAMGWIVTERGWAGGEVLTHSGSNTMWYCVAWLAPKKDFAVLACTNQGGSAATAACDEVASLLIAWHAANSIKDR